MGQNNTADYKIKEMQEGKVPVITETIIDPVKALNRVMDVLGTASEEISYFPLSTHSFVKNVQAPSNY